MFIGIGTPIPEIANLPGTSRPGSGGGGGIVLPQIDNDYYMEFDGVDDEVALGSTINLATTNTISMWVKRDDVAEIDDGLLGNSANDDQAAMWISATSRLYISLSKWVKPFFYVTSLFDTTDWFNLVVVRTGDTANLYVDGVWKDDLTGLGAGDTLIDTIGYLKEASPPNTFHFQGALDEIAFFDYVLSPSEINDIYNATDIAGKKCADLSSMATQPVAWYRMGD